MAKKGKKRARVERTVKSTIVDDRDSTGQQKSLPLPFPSHLPRPKDDFLRDQAPYKESFRVALDTAYEGLQVDETIGIQERTVQDALETMERGRYFRSDVTQPFGLGTSCAKTYVTRCVVGEPGTTYKYLGLRMFAYPWNDCDAEEECRQIRALSDHLTERTKDHLKSLDEKRRKRNAHPVKGRAGFDICLINRMEHSEDLKMEPSIKKSRTSVSWHADSSLEHYSTIAVYQTLKPKATNKKKDQITTKNEWSVALRVAHDSEGPQSSRRGTDIESSIVSETPPIAVSLRSGSTYYLLDDFNHHHQHTVISDAKDDDYETSVRYSCTFRLLRHSHNVQHIIERCQNACRNFHKKGPKLWRSEQLLLTELESEWIRQFYIQGKQHRDSLWKFWKEPVEELLKYWSQLEERTRQTIELLRLAAESRCGAGTELESSPSRAARKARDRRKKAQSSIEELLGRQNGESEGEPPSAFVALYQPMAELLAERARIRGLWSKREKDHVFHGLPQESRPIPVPFSFCVPTEQKRDPSTGHSPIPGTEEELRFLESAILECGKSFDSKLQSDLPIFPSFHTASKSENESDAKMDGYTTTTFALELQDHWAKYLIDGRKTIETRLYPLPEQLVGKKIMILQSPKGRAGVSSMPDQIDLSSSNQEAKIIGWCVFSRVKQYRDRASFQADEGLHMVTCDSGYGWKDDTDVIYGWEVAERGSDCGTHNFSVAVRHMRSLFTLRLLPIKRTTESKPTASGGRKREPKKKKRKRY